MSIALFMLWGLGNLFLWREHQREKKDFLEKFYERSQDVGLTMETLVLPLTRGMDFKKKMLQRTLNDLTKFGQFSALALLNSKGEVFLAAPESAKIPSQLNQEDAVVYNKHDQTYSVVIPLNLGSPNDDPIGMRHPLGPPPELQRRQISGLPSDQQTLQNSVSPSEQLNPKVGTAPDLQRKLDDWRKLRMLPRPKEWLHQIGLHQFLAVISAEQLKRQLHQGDMLRLAISLAILLVFLAVIFMMIHHSKRLLLEVHLQKQELINVELQEKNLAAAGLAHETRTPLGIVRGLAQLQSQDNSCPPSAQERAALMVEQVDRITSRLNDFIEYSRMREPRLMPMDLQVLFKKLEQIFHDDLEDAQIQLCLPTETIAKILGDEDMLQQVFFNLVHNALQVCPAHSSIKISCTLQGQRLDIIVQDNGPGIPSELLDRLFKPYVTGRKNGTGLGLAVVKQICQRHRVEISFHNLASGGACFILSGFERAPDSTSPLLETAATP